MDTCRVHFAGLGQSTANGLYLRLDLTNDPVGDGTTSVFDIDASIDQDFAVSGAPTTNNVSFGLVATAASDTDASYRGMTATVTTSGAGDFTDTGEGGGIIGLFFTASHRGSGTIDTVRGTYSTTNTVLGGGDITNAINFSGFHGAYTGGSVTNYIFLQALDPADFAGTAATNEYVFDLQSPGLFSNTYSLNMLDDAATARFIPSSEANTGITWANQSFTLATTGSASSVILSPVTRTSTTTGRSLAITTTAKTANYTMTDSDDIVTADTSGGAFQIDFPPSPTNGQIHNVILETGGSLLTVSGNGNNIKSAVGSSTTLTFSAYTSLVVVYDSNNWLVR